MKIIQFTNCIIFGSLKRASKNLVKLTISHRYLIVLFSLHSIISDLVETTMLEKQNDARDESVEAVFLSILRQKDLDMRDKKAAIVDFIAAGIHTVRGPRCTNSKVILRSIVILHLSVSKI